MLEIGPPQYAVRQESRDEWAKQSRLEGGDSDCSSQRMGTDFFERKESDLKQAKPRIANDEDTHDEDALSGTQNSLFSGSCCRHRQDVCSTPFSKLLTPSATAFAYANRSSSAKLDAE
jgi:hypothetical protein